jgi:hypothetical protein
VKKNFNRAFYGFFLFLNLWCLAIDIKEGWWFIAVIAGFGTWWCASNLLRSFS